jgi:hypothetical protein
MAVAVARAAAIRAEAVAGIADRICWKSGAQARFFIPLVGTVIFDS